MVRIGYLVIATGAVVWLGDLYYRLLTKWCPPDPPHEPPPDTSDLRLARRRRDALERMWERRPFDQTIE